MIMCDADLDQIVFLHFILLVGILGCKQGSFPLKYLGLPLGANLKFKDRSIWNPIIEKVERKLVGWKQLYISLRQVKLL